MELSSERLNAMLPNRWMLLPQAGERLHSLSCAEKIPAEQPVIICLAQLLHQCVGVQGDGLNGGLDAGF